MNALQYQLLLQHDPAQSGLHLGPELVGLSDVLFFTVSPPQL